MAVKKIVLMCLCVDVLMCQIALAHGWKKVEKGIAYAKAGNIHVFQIDPKQYRFSVATAPEIGLTNTTAKELAKKSKAILAINGGFFSPEQKSIGLILREGKTINPLHPTQWWSVFYILDQKPAITSLTSFRKDSKMEMALQVGPRLIINGKIPKFKPSLARRSGIGIQRNGNIIIAASEQELPMEFFAALLLELDCIDALNLDGGGSTQLFFHNKRFKLDIPGPSLITNAITVFPRK